jgi:hypothetical protein
MDTIQKTFKIGDLVRVKDTTHDDRMPSSRSGILVAPVHATVHYSSREPERTNVWIVLMTNGVSLQFHSMYLESLNTTLTNDR